jgi:hypothetical protein
VGSSPTVDRPPTACSDNEGVELDGIDAVREEATVAARELMSADFLSGLAHAYPLNSGEFGLI